MNDLLFFFLFRVQSGLLLMMIFRASKEILLLYESDQAHELELKKKIKLYNGQGDDGSKDLYLFIYFFYLWKIKI